MESVIIEIIALIIEPLRTDPSTSALSLKYTAIPHIEPAITPPKIPIILCFSRFVKLLIFSNRILDRTKNAPNKTSIECVTEFSKKSNKSAVNTLLLELIVKTTPIDVLCIPITYETVPIQLIKAAIEKKTYESKFSLIIEFTSPMIKIKTLTNKKEIHASKNGKLNILFSFSVFNIAPEDAQVRALNKATN